MRHTHRMCCGQDGETTSSYIVISVVIYFVIADEFFSLS